VRDDAASEVARSAGLNLDEALVTTLRAALPAVAEDVVAAITAEVPSYARAFSGVMGQNIENAVRLALAGFLELASGAEGADPGTPLAPVVAAAYDLGRGEARSGRSMDALLAAYRVGARVAWRELARLAVRSGLDAPTLARFAELVFAYIDEVSAASVTGHADQLATADRVRQRALERLGQSLLAGAPADAVIAAAERAAWEPPATLTAVLLPDAQVRGFLALADPRTLQPTELPLPEPAGEVTVLLVPDAGGRSRQALLRVLRDREAVVGPARPWLRVRASYERAVRVRALSPEPRRTVDTDEHLTELVLGADPEALADLRDRVLAPLAALRPAVAEKLADTLRSWLLHQGRRDEIAADLFVHPQTVRYRMGQLRDLYGDRLDDPRVVLELTVALGHPQYDRKGE